MGSDPQRGGVAELAGMGTDSDELARGAAGLAEASLDEGDNLVSGRRSGEAYAGDDRAR